MDEEKHQEQQPTPTKVKTEESEMAPAPAPEPNQIVTPKKSPKKRERNAVKTEDANDDAPAEESPTKKAKAGDKNGTPKPKGKSRTIPTSMEDLTAEDRMLMSMKEEGKSWEEIGTAWEEMTGEKPAKGSLSTRLNRMKASLASVTKDDQNLLLEAKKEVEENFEKDKWTMISSLMEQKGASQKYSVQVLRKQFQKLSTRVEKSESVDATP